MNVSDAGRLDIDAIERDVAALTVGSPIHYVPVTGSTNALARELALAGATPGTLVITDYQSAGRGRQGRIWDAKPGQDLTFSLILRPLFSPHLLTMACAVAVADALAGSAGIAARIKWPNDVLVDGKKLCGILIETDGVTTIAGIGINVGGTFTGDPELGQRAASLADVGAGALSRERLLVEVLRRLAAIYDDLQSSGAAAATRLMRQWTAELETLGRVVTVHQHDGEITGYAEAVESDGALVLRLDDGTRAVVRWGDVL
ncbi:MAG TPA: biotin--[acetyl-CoA-carboxylase] ligase [Ktedonobacterales bacterium]